MAPSSGERSIRPDIDDFLKGRIGILASMRCQRLPKPEPRHFAQIEAIYEESFPENERIEFDRLRDAALKGLRTLHVAQDHEVIAFGLTFPIAGDRLEFLEYFAVHPAKRGEGIGGLLFEHVLGEAQQVGRRGLLFEIETPISGDALTHESRVRRLRFYQRHDAQLVPCATGYFAPATNSSGVNDMQLLWVSLVDAGESPKGTLLRDCIKDIYVESYGRSPSDELLQRVLDKLDC